MYIIVCIYIYIYIHMQIYIHTPNTLLNKSILYLPRIQSSIINDNFSQTVAKNRRPNEFPRSGNSLLLPLVLSD